MIEKWIDTTVLHRTDVPSNILEKRSVNNVLEDVITVTADIDVSNKLQLYKTPDTSELSKVRGAILKYLTQIARPYPVFIAGRAYRMGKEYDTRLMNSGCGKIGKIHA